MRFAGVDVASETHMVAVMDEKSRHPRQAGGVWRGRQRLCQADQPARSACGHPDRWRRRALLEEPFAALAAGGYSIALINPLRTHRFAQEDLERTKTDAIDEVGIARFAAQKRPATTRLPDLATEELRQLVRHRDRLVQQFGDRVRQLHGLVDLGFPEFTRYIRSLDSELASAVLHDFPTAQAFEGVSVRRLAGSATTGATGSARSWRAA